MACFTFKLGRGDAHLPENRRRERSRLEGVGWGCVHYKTGRAGAQRSLRKETVRTPPLGLWMMKDEDEWEIRPKICDSGKPRWKINLTGVRYFLTRKTSRSFTKQSQPTPRIHACLRFHRNPVSGKRERKMGVNFSVGLQFLGRASVIS